MDSSDDDDSYVYSASDSEMDGLEVDRSSAVRHKKVKKNEVDPRLNRMVLAKSLPYETESLEEMDARLEHIAARLVDCIEAGEWADAFPYWVRKLQNWISMRYPMKKSMRVHLGALFYEIATTPAFGPHANAVASGAVEVLLRPKKLISIKDLRLPWRPLHDMLAKELFPKQRKAGHTDVGTSLLEMAEIVQRFFHPSEYEDMLAAILPRLHGDDIDTILATQAFLVHFLPYSHPQLWLPAMFKIWEGINSGLYDEQMLDLLAQLSVIHVNPKVSNPKRLETIPKTPVNDEEGVEDLLEGDEMDVDGVHEVEDVDIEADGWAGIRKEIGILTEKDFQTVMAKCLRTMGTPVGGSIASAAAGALSPMDTMASQTILQMRKPTNRLLALAEIIVYSMAEDSPAKSGSSLATPGESTPVPAALKRVKASANGLHPSSSTDSLADAGRRADASKTYLAGSKSLEHLAKLIVSCESFFHPSNHGQWTQILAVFIQDLAWQFTARWKAEESSSCKTPPEWRLTSDIRREFVLVLRPVALMSIFAKDGISAGASRSCLRSLSVLEPELIVPAIVERAIPSLTNLEETARTAAVIRTLGDVSWAMVSRHVSKSGPSQIPGILELVLAGIDMNDPQKTTSTVLFLMGILQHIRLEQLPEESPEGVMAGPRNPEPRSDLAVERKEGQEDQPMASPEEEDMYFRQATTGFSAWITDFLGRIFQLYDNMPEEGEGRSLKAGVSQEERTVALVNSMMEGVLTNLSTERAEKVIDEIYDHVTVQVRPNSLRVIGGLILACSNTYPTYTLKKFLPLCIPRIKTELSFGAASSRTTTTTVPVASDAALHWHMVLLLGAVSGASFEMLQYKEELVSLFHILIDKTYAEISYSWAARIIEKVISGMMRIFAMEGRLVNPDVWESEDFKYNHHLYWGKTYRLADIKIDWHIPSQPEIDFVIELTRMISPLMDKLENLLAEPSQSLEWNNDFCRYISYVKYTIAAVAQAWEESPADKTGGEEHRSLPHVPKELIERPKPFAAGVPFSDPKIAQYQELQAYRARFGRILHQAVGVFKAEKEDSSIDAVRLTIRSIGTFLTAYGVEQKAYANLWKAYSYVEKQAKVWNRQKSMPRHLWIQRMEIYHAARLRLNAQRRGRSGLDDDLIKDLVSLAISPFVKTRQIAQATLTSACALYDGVFPMIIPLLLPSLERGVDPDVMKGALYTLGSSTLRQTAVADARFLNPYILTLLRAQHQEKPTIQSLVGAVLDKAVTLLNEPMTLQQGRGPKLAIAIERLLSGLSAGSSDVDLRQRATLGVTESKAFRDKAYLELIPQVLAIAQDPATHWKYTVTAARLLKNLLRRDMATSGAVAEYFVSKIPDTQPALCAHARLATTRLLYLIKLRTLCQGSEEALFLQNGKNPLKRSIRPEVLGDNFTKNYLDSFRIPVDDKSEEDQWMQDKSSAGWLCWGENIIQSRLAKWDENPFQWESDSSEAIEAMRKYVDDPAWWKSVAENWAQEKTRTHLSADNIDVLRSFCQIYQDLPFKHLQPVMEVYLDTADKDKQRALAELLAGLLRGMKHWPGKMRAGLWEWLTPRLPKIYSGVRPDTFKYWSGFFEHTLYQRDPRRMQPMVDYLLEVGQSVDYTQDSAFELKKATALSSSLMRCLAWRFEPWADDFVKLYFGPAISSDYVDIRNLVGGNIMLLDNVRWHPSYPSPRAFLEDCLQNPEKDIMGTKGHLGEEMKRLIEMFPKWREERPSGPSASLSTYDKTGSTVARWLYTGLSDTHAPAVFSYVLPILPEIFQMREMVDSDDLHKIAAFLLVFVTAITPPIAVVKPLMESLLKTLKESPSYKIRLHALPILSIVYYRELPLVDEEMAANIMDVLSQCLQDENQEVRETAAATLSGVLRCSQRASINVLKERYIRDIKASKLPRKRNAAGDLNADYQKALIKLHGAILGVTALIEAFPYTVPKFVPQLLTEVLAEHASDPNPISSTIRTCAASFQRSHADTWFEDKLKFTEDQLSNLSYVISGTSYYA